MKILVANHWLWKLGGSETFTYTLISELVRLGHDVSYYTNVHGVVSQAIEVDFKVPFVRSGSFDLILASHNTMVKYCRENMSGLLIQTCHGTIPKLEQPSVLADAYVAVSKEVELHLLTSGIGKPVDVIYNGIDLARFKPNTVAAYRPNFVLSLSHSEELNRYLFDYFSSRKVHFDAFNKYKNPKWEMEQVINLADLVISCGRGVMEAMACGRPVIVMDDRPYMPAAAEGIVTKCNIEELMFCNFSGRYRQRDPYDALLIDEAMEYIDLYTSEEMRYLARKYFDIRNQVKKYIALWKRLM
jgi:glycosyltransferase involved in cell wall biosynthesis